MILDVLKRSGAVTFYVHAVRLWFLQVSGSKLHIRHYELGALVLPSLEGRYRRSPQFGFCASPHRPGFGANSPPCTAVTGPMAIQAAAVLLLEPSELRRWLRLLSCGHSRAGHTLHFTSLNRGLAFLPGPLPGVGQVTLRAATLADEQMSDAEAASVCLVPLPYALPPTRYAASDVPWSIQEKPHEVQSVWD